MTRFCFPRQVRLLTAGDYQSVFNHTSAKVFAGEFLLLASSHSGDARLGLIVSKKNDKRAVGRNRIKRVVRDSFRQHQAQLDGLDIIFLGRQGIKELDNPVLHQRLEKAWQQLAKKAQRAKSGQKSANKIEK